MERLGLVNPGLKGILFSAVYFILLFLVVAIIGIATNLLGIGLDTTDLQDPTVQILGNIGVVGILVVSLGAGLGEEILFRGALQPRFGLVLTSILFAVVHIQYFDIVSMVVLFSVSMILGYERNKFGTTACIITHALYDILALSAASMI